MILFGFLCRFRGLHVRSFFPSGFDIFFCVSLYYLLLCFMYKNSSVFIKIWCNFWLDHINGFWEIILERFVFVLDWFFYWESSFYLNAFVLFLANFGFVFPYLLSCWCVGCTMLICPAIMMIYACFATEVLNGFLIFPHYLWWTKNFGEKKSSSLFFLCFPFPGDIVIFVF